MIAAIQKCYWFSAELCVWIQALLMLFDFVIPLVIRNCRFEKIMQL